MMVECRFMGNCYRMLSGTPCHGNCEDYEPMPDRDALLALADEIVRCRDCGQAEGLHGMLWCRHWESGTAPGAYCAWGEMRES